MPQSFGEQLRRARLARQFRQREAAKKAGLSPTYLSHLESGDRLPTMVTAVALCAALDCVIVIRPSGQIQILLNGF